MFLPAFPESGIPGADPDSSSMVIARRRVYRNKGDNLAAHLHIDLIDSISQIFIVFRKHSIPLLISLADRA